MIKYIKCPLCYKKRNTIKDKSTIKSNCLTCGLSFYIYYKTKLITIFNTIPRKPSHLSFNYICIHMDKLKIANGSGSGFIFVCSDVFWTNTSRQRNLIKKVYGNYKDYVNNLHLQ